MTRKASSRLGLHLRHWHRNVGAMASLFLLWMAVTGLVISFEDDLSLSSKRVSWPWLMRWYGIERTPAPTSGYSIDGHWLVAADKAQLDGKTLDTALHDVRGAIMASNIIYVATPSELTLLTPEGQRVDVLTSSTLPVSTIDALGRAGDQIAIRHETQIFISADAENWVENRNLPVLWSQPQPLPPLLQQKADALTAIDLPLGRIVADMHSGRLFGRAGVYLVDAAGIAALILSISGLWMYLRIQRRPR
jgi:uncharacterized iron-regulated membrane protein